MATTAITNSICITDPALYTKKPNAHAIIKITAMTYNKLPIVYKIWFANVKSHYRAMAGNGINRLKSPMDQFPDGGFPQLWGTNSTTLVERTAFEYYPSHGMIFTLKTVKKPIMNNLLHLISIVLGTYICSVAFVVVLFKIFFPLKTKEEMERLEMEKLLYTQRLAKRRTRSGRNRISLNGFNRSEQLA